jgi:hypothetical protein
MKSGVVLILMLVVAHTVTADIEVVTNEEPVTPAAAAAAGKVNHKSIPPLVVKEVPEPNPYIRMLNVALDSNSRTVDKLTTVILTMQEAQTAEIRIRAQICQMIALVSCLMIGAICALRSSLSSTKIRSLKHRLDQVKRKIAKTQDVIPKVQMKGPAGGSAAPVE